MIEQTRTPDAERATALYPSMTPRTPAAPTPTTEAAALTAPLYPSMYPAQPAQTSVAAQAESSETDAAPTAPISEAHWARVEDVEQWEADVMAGPLAASLPAARAFLHEHASSELVQMLEQSGYGSNPHVIKFVADLAAKFAAGGAR